MTTATAPASLMCEECKVQLADEAVKSHWLTCPGEKSLTRRRRAGMEADWVPVSHSSLVTFDSCEYRWSLSYGPDRIWVDSGDAANLGNEIHAFAEAIRKGEDYQISSWLPLGEDDDFHFIRHKLEDLIKREVAGWPSLLDARAAYEAILTHSWVIRPGLTAEWRGKIDWLVIDEERGYAYIIDYKTGRKIDYDKDQIQRKEYALAVVRNHPGVWKVFAKTVYLRFGKAVPHHGGDVFDLGDLEEFAVGLEAKVRRLADVSKGGEEPKPSPGEQCALCDYAHLCPAAERLLKPLTINVTDGAIVVPGKFQTEEEIEAAALALFQLDKLTSGLKKALKEISDERDGIHINGGTYRNWKKSAKRVQNLEAVMDYLSNQGIPPSEYMTFNHVTGKKFLERFPSLSEHLVEVEDRYPSFVWKKDPKPDK